MAGKRGGVIPQRARSHPECGRGGGTHDEPRRDRCCRGAGRHGRALSMGPAALRSCRAPGAVRRGCRRGRAGAPRLLRLCQPGAAADRRRADRQRRDRALGCGGADGALARTAAALARAPGRRPCFLRRRAFGGGQECRRARRLYPGRVSDCPPQRPRPLRAVDAAELCLAPRRLDHLDRHLAQPVDRRSARPAYRAAVRHVRLCPGRPRRRGLRRAVSEPRLAADPARPARLGRRAAVSHRGLHQRVGGRARARPLSGAPSPRSRSWPAARSRSPR